MGVIAFAVLICFLLAIANFAGERFFERYEEVDKVFINNNLTPLGFANSINQKYFNGKLSVIPISSLASDAYSKQKLFLSDKTLSTNSVASFAIIAHELGHAMQDNEGNKLKRLFAFRRLGRILSMLFVPAIIVGVVLMLFNLMLWGVLSLSIGGGILFMSFAIKLRTIYLEKDASQKALKLLEGVLTEDELEIAKQFTNDAKLTYWADFLRLLLWWTALSKKSKLFN